MLPMLLCILGVLISVEGAVLDPALYLLPSPPLVTSSDSLSPGERWKTSEPIRVTREANTPDTAIDKELTQTTEASESMEGSETFWPGLRPSAYGIRGIHIPLTFSITGQYGSSGFGTGVVGSSYASISGEGYGSGSYGKSALAGSSYGTYPGVRVFGSNGKSGWSGWGNGKWGHYGKG